MDKMPFRPKPKVVDLTSDRKLADKVPLNHSHDNQLCYTLMLLPPAASVIFFHTYCSCLACGLRADNKGWKSRVPPCHAAVTLCED